MQNFEMFQFWDYNDWSTLSANGCNIEHHLYVLLTHCQSKRHYTRADFKLMALFVCVCVCIRIRRYFSIICYSQNDESLFNKYNAFVNVYSHTFIYACMRTIGTKISTNFYGKRIFASHSHAPSHIHWQ